METLLDSLRQCLASLALSVLGALVPSPLFLSKFHTVSASDHSVSALLELVRHPSWGLQRGSSLEKTGPLFGCRLSVCGLALLSTFSSSSLSLAFLEKPSPKRFDTAFLYRPSSSAMSVSRRLRLVRMFFHLSVDVCPLALPRSFRAICEPSRAFSWVRDPLVAISRR